jgi:N,N-dimethylformamidase beta subunit-like, C-terminal
MLSRLAGAVACALLWGGVCESASATVAGFEAYFSKRSYGPGQRVPLRISGASGAVTVQVLRAGGEGEATRADDMMKGAPVSAMKVVRPAGRGWSQVPVWIGRWPSGLYFAALRSTDGQRAFAPFVLRAAPRERAPVAVVMPTNTWQAYNFRDGDHDGVGDTWYASDRVHQVRLARPFDHRGVPPHYRHYDAGFLRWLAGKRHRADFLADDDLETFRDGRQLARRYSLIVFPGHEEYVTDHAYGLIERYVARDGNLMFLSANNFFYRVARAGSRIVRTGRWRDIGRPEARWIGVQYVDWFQNRYPDAPFVIVAAQAAPWLFRGSDLRNGDRFGSYGIEIDSTTSLSPPATHVLARIADIFGPGKSAEMTYRETPAGAKIFAAGALDFGGSALQAPVTTMIENLWTRLSSP